MSLTDRIFAIWATSHYKPPTVPLIFYENEFMVTVDDSETFLRFMSSDGQIFLALNKNCQITKPAPIIGNSAYVCSKVDPILCSPTSGPDSIRDIFVLNNITPLLY
jgi:hypothetical protein